MGEITEEKIAEAKALAGKNVYKLRKVNVMSQVRFAKLIGVNRSYLSGLEKGIKNPSVTMFYRIATELNISVKQLLTRYTYQDFSEILEQASKEERKECKHFDNVFLGKKRREFQLLQEELAKMAGLSRNHISGIERGIYNPTLATVTKLAITLDCDIADFF